MELSKFFVKAPLIPVICQDERSGEVLMLGYMNGHAGLHSRSHYLAHISQLHYLSIPAIFLNFSFIH